MVGNAISVLTQEKSGPGGRRRCDLNKARHKHLKSLDGLSVRFGSLDGSLDSCGVAAQQPLDCSIQSLQVRLLVTVEEKNAIF